MVYTKETREYNSAEEIFNEMLTASQASDNILSNFQSKRNLASSYTFLGDIKRLTKKNDEANEFYEKAHDITLSMSQDVSDEDSDLLKKDLAIAYNRLAIIYKRSLKWDKAKEYYAKSHELTLEATCNSPLDWWNRAIGYYDMSNVTWDAAIAGTSKKRPDDPEASESLGYLKLSKECMEELMKEYLGKNPSKERTKFFRTLIKIYNYLAQRNTAAHRIVRRQYYGCALELLKIKLREEHPSPLSWMDTEDLNSFFEGYGYAHFDYSADIFYKQSELSQHKQALFGRIDEKYVDDNPLNICPEVESVYFELGRTTEALEEYSTARLLYTKALNCLLNKNDKSLENLDKLISCYENLGDCFLEYNPLASRAFYQKISAISDSLSHYPASPELVSIKNKIADVFEKIAHVLKTYFTQSTTSLDESLLRKEVSTYFFKCLEIRKELCETAKDDLSKEKLAFAYYNVAKQNTFQDADEIKNQLNAAISIWNDLINKHPNDPIYPFLIECANGKSMKNPFDF